MEKGTDVLKEGFAKMTKGGVIMDVVNAEQAGIAEDAGAVAVMALEKVPADIRAAGGVARMADPTIVEAVRHMRMVLGEIRTIQGLDEEELWKYARKIEAPIDLVKETAQLGKLPVVNFAAGGIATPADASLMMQLGSDGIFVGSGIFKSNNPEAFAKAIVEATANYDKPEVLAEVSKGLGEAMKGLEMSTLSEADRMQDRGI